MKNKHASKIEQLIKPKLTGKQNIHILCMGCLNLRDFPTQSENIFF